MEELVKERYSIFAAARKHFGRDVWTKDGRGIVETWLTTDVDNSNITIDGYTIVRADRETRGGGVALYLKNNLRYDVLNIPSTNELEQRWVSFHYSKQKFVVGALYRPPNKSFEEFLSEFEDVLTITSPISDRFVCGGDVNINLLDITSSKQNQFCEIYESFSLKQLINKPTRITSSSATLLDIILVNDNDSSDVLSADVTDVHNIADHALVHCKLKCSKTYPERNERRLRNFKRIDNATLDHILSLTPFQHIFWIESIDHKIKYINQLLLNIFDTAAPKRVIKFERSKPPLFTDTIKTLIRKRDKAFNEFRKSGDQSKYTYYKVLRNQANIVIRNEKKD
nr:unnamed protein product [Callosobruchus analis]